TRLSLIARTPRCRLLAVLFTASASPEIYTLSLHDALPIYVGDGLVDGVDHAHRQDRRQEFGAVVFLLGGRGVREQRPGALAAARSEEHTSELQSRENLVCRLLLEKKNSATATTNRTVPEEK